MSKETDLWLNTMCLIGFVDKRREEGLKHAYFREDGRAWHYDEALQGDESNHYSGAIPVDDVLRRLFFWHAVSAPLYIKGSDFSDRLGSGPILVPDRQAMVAEDNGDVLGIFKKGYEGHQYDEWLIENIAKLVADYGLGIAAAGLLRNRAQAFVQIELPENFETPEGFTFRPFISGSTSFDGSLATTYKKGATGICCDNSLHVGLAEEGEIFRVKHTSNSRLRLTDARDALGIIEQIGDEFSSVIAQLAATDVTLKEWQALLDEMAPVPEDKGRARSLAEKKREELNDLYTKDDRAAPWTGTGLGVLQAFNTWGQHFRTVHGVHRVERNFSDMLFGNIGDADNNTLQVLDNIRAQRTLVHA